MHQLNNYVESTRKRLKHIEDIDGLSKCSLFLQQLQVDNVAKKNVVKNTRAASTCLVDSEDDDYMDIFADPKENEELETADAILERQVALDTPAKAKAAANKIITAKKQVTFVEKPASTQENTTTTAEEPAHVETETPPSPKEKGKEIWKAVKPRSHTKPATKTTEQERSCWLYFYNYVSRDN